MDYLAWLLDSSSFMTRDQCGQWTAALIFWYSWSNFCIAIAYFMIPAAIMVLWWYRYDDLPRPWMVLLFATFIFLCGLTHLEGVLVFEWAPYRLFTLVRVMTATASMAAATLLPGTVWYLLHLPTPENYRASLMALGVALGAHKQELAKRKRVEQELRDRNDELEIKLGRMSEIIESRLWASERERDISELKELIRSARENGSRY